MVKSRVKNESLSPAGKTKSPNSDGITCLVCGKVFRYEHRMKLHARTHTGETPYPCPYCVKSFAQKAALVVHERTHTGERPFGCVLCGKRFSRADHLNQHARTHTGEKPYACGLCSRAFATWSALSRHKAEHQTRDSFICTFCSKTFSRSDNLRTHIAKRHANLLSCANAAQPQPEEAEDKISAQHITAGTSEEMSAQKHIKEELPDPVDEHSLGSHFLAAPNN